MIRNEVHNLIKMLTKTFLNKVAKDGTFLISRGIN